MLTPMQACGPLHELKRVSEQAGSRRLSVSPFESPEVVMRCCGV